ncbi:MAG TPA: hypothetical protein VMT34_12770 [Aggregatilineales bacterium]|nr:hypothetical protein [Aggregatilineales bacterium]
MNIAPGQPSDGYFNPQPGGGRETNFEIRPPVEGSLSRDTQPTPERADANHVQKNSLNYITESVDDLSQSCYDIGVVALAQGAQNQGCVQWLIEHHNADGTWGAPPQLSWYDTYVCTYAAGVALHRGGCDQLAARALDQLPRIAAFGSERIPETLTFGGLVGALDRFCATHGWPVPSHTLKVRTIVAEEQIKWDRMLEWKGFYDPRLSIAGYSAEKVYLDERIDLPRFLKAFQSVNGSISNSAAASAMFLLEAERRGLEPDSRMRRLNDYVKALDPYKRAVGYLDFASHFVTAWAIMYLSELGQPSETVEALHVIAHQIDDMYASLYDSDGLTLLCPVGLTTIPGDTDSTACAIYSAVYAGRRIPNIDRLNAMFVPEGGYYQTFLFERDPSLSTNIHVAALLAQYKSPLLNAVVDWLADRVVRHHDLICKWHVSAIYTIGELARVMAHIDHPKSRELFLYAVEYLLDAQREDGGWGTLGTTVEESGYAVLGLAAVYEHLITAVLPDAGLEPAAEVMLRRIYQSLQHAEPILFKEPFGLVPLWIGKSLYCVNPLVPVLREVSQQRIRRVQELHVGLS